MRVGVYIDGFNLYYGARKQFGAAATGWKWLDVRSLARERVQGWPSARIERVVYCTARVNDADDPGQTVRQRAYLAALRDSGSVDILEEGFYQSYAKRSLMTAEPAGRRNPTPLIDSSLTWSEGLNVERKEETGHIFATVRKREEKGSDVNLATHLLVDVLSGDVDAALVISNDSDLALPIRTARQHVPVGTLNPSSNPTAGRLKGHANEGVGRHFWGRIGTQEYLRHQLPEIVGESCRPEEW